MTFDLEEFKRWDPKTQARVLEAIQRARESDGKAWYCRKGRGCDGKAHKDYDYPHARGDQWPPAGADWLTWLLRGGRGSGKTRSGSEWTRKKIERAPRFALVGPTAGHVRDIMVEGQSGIQAVFARVGQSVDWEPSKRKITCPNGAVIHTYSAEEPDRLRGPEHYAAWLDEPAHMDFIDDVWDNLLLGLRLGMHPQILCTTTPLPVPWIKALVKEEDTVSVQVSTYVNLDNLAPTFRKTVLDKYEGTRLGRQELHGEILEDVEGALWNWEMIQANRDSTFSAEQMERIVVAVDPAGTSTKKRDECGIVVIGKIGRDFYVLADASGHFTPEGWASKVWALYDTYQADCVVAEKNYGGEMVSATLRHSRKGDDKPMGKITMVTSRRGKELRAEPVVGLYEQGRVHHTRLFETLEDQQTTWVPGVGSSPDRVDALVHGVTELGGITEVSSVAVPHGKIGSYSNPRSAEDEARRRLSKSLAAFRRAKVHSG